MEEAFKDHKILIVDDMPANIKVIAEALRPWCKVIFAKSGAEALQIVYSDDPPDLILLDIVMPEMDGYEVCRKIKADPKVNGIPVIFISAKGEESDEATGLELGAVDYIAKPSSPAIVKARVKTHLELKRHRDILEKMLNQQTRLLEESRQEFLRLFTRQLSQAEQEEKQS